MNAQGVRELISVVTGSEKYGGRGPPWVPYKPRNHAWGCPGEGWSAVGTLASSFDGWVLRGLSLARVPLLSRVLKHPGS